MASERVLIARIGAAHGIRGEVRLWPFTADPSAVKEYGPLSAADGRCFEIAALRPGKDFLVARLKGVTDRNAAEALTNLELYVDRARLPAAEEDEFYHADLIGLAAVTADGEPFGTVRALHDFGGGTLIELAPMSGGDTVLLPFTKATVPKVDIAGGHIVVTPPEATE